ncbi:hypothetical protein [Streptomyces sp. NPDC048057]|uniref:hypothetical protein n=1 Tax=Streptomyces sp. NPDC048057 TaxID=3155628 RepID=UPI00340EE551
MADFRRGLAAVAASPGTTEERLGAEREARALLSRLSRQTQGARTDVRADRVYGGDHIEVVIGQGERAVRAHQLTEEALDQCRATYVPSRRATDGGPFAGPDPWRLVLLAGRQGSGKYAAACHRLLDLGHRRLHRLESGADLTRLDVSALTRGDGYLLPDLPEAVAQRTLSAFELQRVARALAAHDCRLVVTLREEAVPADLDLAAYVQWADAPPDPWDVFASHLLWRLGPARAGRGRELLASAEVRELVNHQATAVPGRSLSSAAEAARVLAATDGEPARAAADAAARLDPRQGFEDWFTGLADLHTQCLAVSVAAFAGEAYETADGLARALKELLQQPETPDHPDRPRNHVVGATRAVRLRRLHATLIDTEVEGRYGETPAKAVHYLDPDVPPRVLQTAWEEYDDIRAALPGWLQTCAGHELPTVRARAAVVAGFLAGLSFDTLRSGTLTPWAASTSPQLREAAATALRTAAEHPGLVGPVRDLVRAWAAEPVGTPYRAAAARGFFALLREEDRGGGEAVALLHELAGEPTAAVAEAICVSVAEYLSHGGSRHERTALALLRHWVALRDPERRTVGELAFLFAAADLRQEMPAGRGRPRGRKWPRLLALAAADPVRQRDVARLWEAVLLSPEPQATAAAVLREWARAVNDDPLGRRSLARLLRAAASSPRAGRVIRHHVRAWQYEDDKAALTAAQVEHVLDQVPYDLGSEEAL